MRGYPVPKKDEEHLMVLEGIGSLGKEVNEGCDMMSMEQRIKPQVRQRVSRLGKRAKGWGRRSPVRCGEHKRYRWSFWPLVEGSTASAVFAQAQHSPSEGGHQRALIVCGLRQLLHECYQSSLIAQILGVVSRKHSFGSDLSIGC